MIYTKIIYATKYENLGMLNTEAVKATGIQLDKTLCKRSDIIQIDCLAAAHTLLDQLETLIPDFHDDEPRANEVIRCTCDQTHTTVLEHHGIYPHGTWLSYVGDMINYVKYLRSFTRINRWVYWGEFDKFRNRTYLALKHKKLHQNSETLRTVMTHLPARNPANITDEDIKNAVDIAAEKFTNEKN